MPIVRTPGQIATAKASDQVLAQKFFLELVGLANDFARRHPDAAHGVMVSTMADRAHAGRSIGMKESDFITYATLVFRDKAGR